MNDWIEEEVSIGLIRNMMADGYEIEADSPDGWVPISEFVDKGMWDEYVLRCEDAMISCNENHLFETPLGWMKAREIENIIGGVHVLTKTGYKPCTVVKTDRKITIVDIQINHPNHRYYTEGVSSHNTKVGKSLVLCHMSAANLLQGKNVLYITLEMAEEKIAERIDANLMNTMLEDLRSLPRDAYDSKINRLKRKTLGRLIIKEFPTATAHVGHFRHLLNELNLKKNFVPDIIYIDYLNICASSRMKQGGSVNSYTYVKAIAEELRGLAVEKNVPVFSATQTNRTGYVSSDVGLEDVSESFGLAATADFMIAIITSEELAELNQYMVKQLKNRYADVNANRKFVIGVDRSRMKLYDAEQSAQENIYQETSVMDKTSFGERDKEDSQMKWKTKKMGRRDFSGLKTS